MAAKKKTTRRTAATPKPSQPSAVRPVKTTPRIAKVATTKKAAASGETVNAQPAPLPVVGIGASAGGLDALKEFFRAMRATSGMAFVIVTHLDPGHKSALAEILSHVTSMPVSEVSDGAELLPDHVYVLPPNANMVVMEDRLHLAPRGETHGPHMPIDVFLRSLAIARTSRAVGVILSGTATDGTLGLMAIKSEGASRSRKTAPRNMTGCPAAQ